MKRLLLFLLISFIPAVSFGQAFSNINDPSQYNNGSGFSFIPINQNQAVLEWRLAPPVTVSGAKQVVSANIIQSVKWSGLSSSTYGWYKNINEEYSVIYSVIDSSHIYSRSSGSSTIPLNYLNEIQSILLTKGLGTQKERSLYIASLKLHNVRIIDTSSIAQSFQTLLGPWAKIGVALMIALFCLEFGSRNTKQIAGDAAKEVRKAERQALRDEIKNDRYAQAFRARMKYFADASRDYLASAEFRRESREWLEQTALDYAKYKKSRGWSV